MTTQNNVKFFLSNNIDRKLLICVSFSVSRH